MSAGIPEPKTPVPSDLDIAQAAEIDPILAVATLDTGENYGNNLYATLAGYLGPELKDELALDLARWQAWWEANRETFDLAAALARKAEREAAQE